MESSYSKMTDNDDRVELCEAASVSSSMSTHSFVRQQTTKLKLLGVLSFTLHLICLVCVIIALSSTHNDSDSTASHFYRQIDSNISTLEQVATLKLELMSSIERNKVELEDINKTVQESQYNDLRSCDVRNGECEYNCSYDSIGNLTCGCPVGLRLSNNQKTCIDENECEVSPCLTNEKCVNSYGSYFCASMTSQHSAQKQLKVSCQQPYKYNPYSNSCLLLVRSNQNWPTAKSFCESRGEYLATFQSWESAMWLINARKTNPEWKASDFWIGGRRNNETLWLWEWVSPSNPVIDNAPWGGGQPNHPTRNEFCLVSWEADNYMFHDLFCSWSRPFLCEKF